MNAKAAGLGVLTAAPLVATGVLYGGGALTLAAVATILGAVSGWVLKNGNGGRP